MTCTIPVRNTQATSLLGYLPSIKNPPCPPFQFYVNIFSLEILLFLPLHPTVTILAPLDWNGSISGPWAIPQSQWEKCVCIKQIGCFVESDSDLGFISHFLPLLSEVCALWPKDHTCNIGRPENRTLDAVLLFFFPQTSNMKSRTALYFTASVIDICSRIHL